MEKKADDLVTKIVQSFDSLHDDFASLIEMCESKVTLNDSDKHNK